VVISAASGAIFSTLSSTDQNSFFLDSIPFLAKERKDTSIDISKNEDELWNEIALKMPHLWVEKFYTIDFDFFPNSEGFVRHSCNSLPLYFSCMHAAPPLPHSHTQLANSSTLSLTQN
jgi:hypothetical protein